VESQVFKVFTPAWLAFCLTAFWNTRDKVLLQHKYCLDNALDKVPPKPKKHERAANPTKYNANYMKMYESRDTNNEKGQNFGGLGNDAQQFMVDSREYLASHLENDDEEEALAAVFFLMLEKVKAKHNIYADTQAEQARLAKKRRLNGGEMVAEAPKAEPIKINDWSASEDEGDYSVHSEEE